MFECDLKLWSYFKTKKKKKRQNMCIKKLIKND